MTIGKFFRLHTNKVDYFKNNKLVANNQIVYIIIENQYILLGSNSFDKKVL